MNDGATQTNTNLDVAKTILAQLGGNRFLAMTGARDLTGGEKSLTFKIGRGAKRGINAVRVTLDASDTYTVEFIKIGRGWKVETVEEISLVYGDSLRAVFTEHTGFRTSL
jgi:hypothetical protein